nr:CHAT domain-containing protein [Clostridium sp.]
MWQLDKYRQCIAGLHEKYPKIVRFGSFSLTNISDILQKVRAIPQDACFIDFTVLRENNPDNLILACIASRDGTVKAVPIPVDKSFSDNCHIYHEILSYASLEGMQGEDKYLWKGQDGSYKIVTDNEYTESDAKRVRTTQELENARQELAARISASLIAPIKDVIPASASRWIISPDGALNNVPFETLVYNGKALIDSKDVSYVPSLSVMK